MIAVIMIVVAKVLVKALVLNPILVKRMKMAIVLLAAVVPVLVRTTIIAGSKLNDDTNHNNSNSCSSRTTIATINTHINNYEDKNGNHHRISTYTNIYKKALAIVGITA